MPIFEVNGSGYLATEKNQLLASYDVFKKMAAILNQK